MGNHFFSLPTTSVLKTWVTLFWKTFRWFLGILFWEYFPENFRIIFVGFLFLYSSLLFPNSAWLHHRPLHIWRKRAWIPCPPFWIYLSPLNILFCRIQMIPLWHLLLKRLQNIYLCKTGSSGFSQAGCTTTLAHFEAVLRAVSSSCALSTTTTAATTRTGAAVP